MNTITVTAHGQPGSLVRRAQESPGFVVDLYRAAMDSYVAISTIVAEGEHEQIRRPSLPVVRDRLARALRDAGGFSDPGPDLAYPGPRPIAQLAGVLCLLSDAVADINSPGAAANLRVVADRINGLAASIECARGPEPDPDAHQAAGEQEAAAMADGLEEDRERSEAASSMGETAAALREMREGVTAGVAETTLGVSGQEPPPAPLVITGPGGDFRTEHRPCACCKCLFTAVAGGPGKYCQKCLDRRAAMRLEREETEPDYGGVFDGTRVISDADPGL